MKKLVPIIGLEVHIELSTNSKMFCGCPADHFAKEANTQVCPVCLGLPGALPFANTEAINRVVSFGLAMDCTIAPFSKFDRKHYFYPDLPKSYQISQYDLPFCTSGHFEIKDPNGSMFVANIRRIHLEEDTAKMQHSTINGKRVSLVDYNRSSVPLVEMVTEPDFHDAETVALFLKEVQKVVRYLGISTADMEKGSMRLEANISMAEEGYSELPSYKVELKNINSFVFLKKALEAEIKRQSEALEKGETLIQETRGYDELHDKTVSQRVKEEAADYRYFPEPDLPPVTFTPEAIAALKANLPELPAQKRERFISVYDLSSDYADILTRERARAEYFEAAVSAGKSHNLTSKQIANAMINQHLDTEHPEPASLVTFLATDLKKEYSNEDDVTNAVTDVINQNPDVVTKYKNGKVEVLGFLLGQTQRTLKGKGDPKHIQEILQKLLS
ncbi:Asp-tRNA(Asn)/Glu-tRNA(Gln) amidotransferase subunit GatB [Candidatus Woesebacteria bacterium]|nr:Asp-tRNA(Asn)/Glu-tRNA(Gln) amidotransferase subunit GatB [Candidatus Woesebacteria bacterium]